MSEKDLRGVSSTKPQNGTAGNRVVTYVDAKLRSMNATVLGSGTASGLKLYLSHYSPGNQVKDNVPLATSKNSVLSYHARQ